MKPSHVQSKSIKPSSNKGYKSLGTLPSKLACHGQKNILFSVRQHEYRKWRQYGEPSKVSKCFFVGDRSKFPQDLIDIVYNLSAQPTNEVTAKLIEKLITFYIDPTGSDTSITQFLCSFELLEVLLSHIASIYRRAAESSSRCHLSTILDFPSEQIDFANTILHLVNECIAQVPGYSITHLRKIPYLLEALFALFQTENTYFPSPKLQVMEDLLLAGSSTSPVILEEIKGLSDLMLRLSGQTLCQFYHLLSAVMTDIEFVASSHSSLHKQDQWLLTPTSWVSEQNQEFLLRVPDFLEKMCQHLSKALPRERGQRDGNHDDLMTVLSNSLGFSEDIFDEIYSGEDDILRQITLYREKTARSDLFLIISLLLSGKHRNEVQRRILACRFIQDLHLTFRSFVWDNKLRPLTPSDTPYPEECNPNTVIKIQFLRLVHSVAENHANRYLFLSAYEVEKLKQYAKDNDLLIPDDLRDLDAAILFGGEQGILSQVVDLLRYELSTSCVRFWTTRALEAFLRGETCPLDQSFLMNKRLVENIVSPILSTEPRIDTVIQGTFDFLSTLLRLNLEGFRRLETIIDCSAKFQIFMAAIEYSLVDSNMFIRCVILTIHHIRHRRVQEKEMLKTSRLLRHFDDVDYCATLVAQLIRLLRVSTLSQENVSCLNTSLLILVLGHRDDQMPRYLKQLKEMIDGEKILNNFASLLFFWDNHYTLPIKKTDCKSLETSSGVKFTEWRSVVSLLLCSDALRPTSIYYYLESSTDV